MSSNYINKQDNMNVAADLKRNVLGKKESLEQTITYN